MYSQEENNATNEALKLFDLILTGQVDVILSVGTKDYNFFNLLLQIS